VIGRLLPHEWLFVAGGAALLGQVALSSPLPYTINLFLLAVSGAIASAACTYVLTAQIGAPELGAPLIQAWRQDAARSGGFIAVTFLVASVVLGPPFPVLTLLLAAVGLSPLLPALLGINFVSSCAAVVLFGAGSMMVRQTLESGPSSVPGSSPS
jgi:hypothetical protein